MELHPIEEAIIFVLAEKPLRASELHRRVKSVLISRGKKGLSKPLLFYHLKKLARMGIVFVKRVEKGSEKYNRYALSPFRATFRFRRDNGEECKVLALWWQKNVPLLVIDLEGKLNSLTDEERKRLFECGCKALRRRIETLVKKHRSVLDEYFSSLTGLLRETG